MNTYVLYESRTGTTKKMADNIAAYLKEKDINADVDSIDDANKEKISNADILFLGCWTHGLMILLQHPVKKWVKFTSSLDNLENKKVVLFTTYKLLDGSMFRKMEKALEGKNTNTVAHLKTKFGKLNDTIKEKLNTILKG